MLRVLVFVTLIAWTHAGDGGFGLFCKEFLEGTLKDEDGKTSNKCVRDFQLENVRAGSAASVNPGAVLLLIPPPWRTIRWTASGRQPASVKRTTSTAIAMRFLAAAPAAGNCFPIKKLSPCAGLFSLSLVTKWRKPSFQRTSSNRLSSIHGVSCSHWPLVKSSAKRPLFSLGCRHLVATREILSTLKRTRKNIRCSVSA